MPLFLKGSHTSKQTRMGKQHSPLLLEACTIMGKQHYFFEVRTVMTKHTTLHYMGKQADNLIHTYIDK
uniref:Uncharacterized protein n=1 Tax=Populus trichocarpa TaxID=3694 RepID=U5GX51_POPTR